MLSKKQTYEETLSGKKVKVKGISPDKKEIELTGRFIAFGLEVAKPAGTASYTVALIRQDRTGEVFSAPPTAVLFME